MHKGLDKTTQTVIADFRRWLRGINIKQTIWDRDKYMIGGKICVDYFIRFEKLFEGISEVCNKLNIPQPKKGDIPRLKTGRRKHDVSFKDFYDEKCAKKVRDAFKFELEYFNYSL